MVTFICYHVACPARHDENYTHDAGWEKFVHYCTKYHCQHLARLVQEDEFLIHHTYYKNIAHSSAKSVCYHVAPRWILAGGKSPGGPQLVVYRRHPVPPARGYLGSLAFRKIGQRPDPGVPCVEGLDRSTPPSPNGGRRRLNPIGRQKLPIAGKLVGTTKPFRALFVIFWEISLISFYIFFCRKLGLGVWNCKFHAHYIFFIGTIVLPMLPFFPTLLGLWEIWRDEEKKNLRILVRIPTFFSERELRGFCRDENKENPRILVIIPTFFLRENCGIFAAIGKKKSQNIGEKSHLFFWGGPVRVLSRGER